MAKNEEKKEKKGISLTPKGKETTTKPKSRSRANPKEKKEDKAEKFSKEVDLAESSIPTAPRGSDPSKEWAREFIQVDLTPSPVNVFGTDFLDDAKDYLYKTLEVITDEKPKSEYVNIDEDQWIDLINTYALQNLSEDEKIARIVTEDNIESFKGLIELFVREDPFRASILHLCAQAHDELEKEKKAEGSVIELEVMEEPKPKIVINFTPEEESGEVSGDTEVYLFSQNKKVDILEGKRVNITDGESEEEKNVVKEKKERMSLGNPFNDMVLGLIFDAADENPIIKDMDKFESSYKNYKPVMKGRMTMKDAMDPNKVGAKVLGAKLKKPKMWKLHPRYMYKYKKPIFIGDKVFVLEVPDIKVPNIKVPDVKLPKMPKLKLPFMKKKETDGSYVRGK